MNPVPNHNHHEPTEDGSEICGNMAAFRDYEDLNINFPPRQLRGIAAGDGSSTSHLDTFYPTFRQQEPRRYENHARSLFNIDMGPELNEEPKPLFHEARNSGSASSSASDQVTLLDLNYLLNKFCHEVADNSYQYSPMSLQQPPASASISPQRAAASTMPWNNRAPPQNMTLFPVNMTPPLVQPYKNTVLPEETLFSYTDNPYQRTKIPIYSRHEGVPITEFGTKEMSSNTNISEMLAHTTHSFLSSTSNTLNTDNVRSGWELMKTFSNKTHGETQPSQDPNVSGKSSRNGSACGGRSKVTLIASGTSTSEGLMKFSQLSLSTEGGRKKCAFSARNGETEQFMRSHTLHNSQTGLVERPILRSMHCEPCGAKGNFAHNRSRAPRFRKQQEEMQSTAHAIASTQRKSNVGRKKCAFSARNGETEQFMRSRTWHNSQTGLAERPILRSMHCEPCGAKGNFAHKRSRAPRFRKQQEEMQSTESAFASTQRKSNGGRKWCAFCARKGEPKQFVRTHTLRDSQTGLVECPILRSIRCEACGATGDFAHTHSYCPYICMQQEEKQSTAHAIASTQRKSNSTVHKYRAKN